MTRGRRERQASVAGRGIEPRRATIASRLRAAARATGVATVFGLSAVAGFGTEPTATRPVATASDFAPRPYAMSYAVREVVAQARAERQFAGVVAALEASREMVSAPVQVPVPVAAYGETDRAGDRAAALDRFDAFVGGTLALGAATQAVPDVPVPAMRPVGPDGLRP